MCIRRSFAQLVAATAVVFTDHVSSKTPIIYVPGGLASSFLASSAAPPPPCAPSPFTDKQVWPPTADLIAQFDCWAAILRMQFDPATNTSSNAAGVTIRQPGFEQEWFLEMGSGDTMSGVGIPLTATVTATVATLAGFFNFSGATVIGASYDFRKTPKDDPQWLEKMKALVERAYADNGNSKTILMATSFGCIWSYAFLRAQTQEWKDTYIRQYIAIGCPLGGTATLLYPMISGAGSGYPQAAKLRDLLRSWPGLYAGLPTAAAYGPAEVLVKLGVNGYTTNNLDRLFDANGLAVADGKAKFETYNKGYMDTSVGPGVPVLCVYGSKLPTMKSLTYGSAKDAQDQRPPTMGSSELGDGVIPERSATLCANWPNSQLFEEPSYNHFALATNQAFINFIQLNTPLEITGLRLPPGT